MSKTTPVIFDDGTVEYFFWAYDVALAVLFAHAIRIADRVPASARCAGHDELVADMKVQIEIGASSAVILDSYERELLRTFRSWLAEACDQLTDRGGVWATEYRELGFPDRRHFRGAEHIEPGPMIDIAIAIGQLLDGNLPPAPDGSHWFIGTGRITTC
ncbi:hypothetical protein [Nocardia carnea]|uniref:hypothetical protein n=1 Tax=Nocardia carnea TaxID=37328 RepID=UPI0024579B39|nr:hypothetical protein [Nocardia carnea]